jgi:hypothetical protein
VLGEPPTGVGKRRWESLVDGGRGGSGQVFTVLSLAALHALLPIAYWLDPARWLKPPAASGHERLDVWQLETVQRPLRLFWRPV